MLESISRLTPQAFRAKWRGVALKERSFAQEHFLDLCHMLGQPTPAEADPDGSWFTFEKGADKSRGGKGFADVWLRGRFAWEYKGNHADLAAAYQQLLQYRDAWLNPPGLSGAELKTRTLTNLYNKRPTWLAQAHETLDRAVLAAYGWDDLDPAAFDEDELLARLLVLNLRQAATSDRPIPEDTPSPE